ncbi:uncharacterized protein LOC118412627 [Branchiostoma floridae]|uniref:Uncharacterized protein LOC118412627 n=1 Tax=Branchiostoma floridae TaxID=7739 RepID=A0A9J7KW22_BRAFL|nr:uncharacterized protein LOC118412627 [Branchiostoma floridae]XP_035671512.1 uncharacterized protein LOC118412627 [Branchiostoma floridae]
MADSGSTSTVLGKRKRKTGAGRPRKYSTPAKKLKIQEMKRTRVYLGDAYNDWKDLRERLGLKSDRELACELMKSFKEKMSVPRTSSPKCTFQSLSLFGDESSVGTQSDDDGSSGSIVTENVCVPPQCEDLEDAVSSIHHPTTRNPESENEPGNEPENEREINALENIGISVELDNDDEVSDSDSVGYFDDVSGDPDYEPPAMLKATYKLLGKDIESLDIITAEEEVFCHDMAPGEEDESLLGEESLDTEEEGSIEEPASPATRRFPRQLKILKPEDIVDQQCSIMYKCSLEQLLGFLEIPADMRKCRVPSCSSSGLADPSMETVASGVVVKWLCKGGHLIWRWFSQPRLKYGIQGGDFMQASSLLLSGNNYAKYSLMCKFMSLGCVNASTFYKIQSQYCVGTIDEFWSRQQRGVIRHLRTKEEVVLLGDGRMDSPGYCAQYCTYTVMDNESKSIVTVEVVDKRETDRKSTVMEKAGFQRAMDDLLNRRVPVKEVCTDAHVQIGSLMRPDKGVYGKKGIHHSLDVWHGAKNLAKKLVKAGDEKGCTDLKPWSKDIVNHFWHACKKANTYEEFMGMWKGVLHHVVDEHTWGSGSCHHDPIDPTVARTKKWLVPGSAAHKRLKSIIYNKRWLKTVTKYLRFRTTSDLESFQNHILMYASKRHSFTPPVYKARCQLAALDYNAHKDRPVWKTKDGHIKYRRRFQKKSDRWSIYVSKQPKHYAYIRDLQSAIVLKRINSHRGMRRTQPLSETDPRRLGNLASIPAPPTHVLVEQHKSRMTDSTQGAE